MALQIVSGKPGSGKSYHTVTMLLQHLEDWIKFERKEGKPFDRVLYTNLPLRDLPINELLSARIGEDVDASHYIRPIDEDVRKQFIQNAGKFPLAVIPSKAFIVIDEVHKMFGSEMDTDKKNKQFDIEFRNYIAQHRHYGHDLIFITQHTDNISKAILAMAEKLYLVENAKHYGLPFPINIPFSDLDVVKEAFGFKQQFYRVSVGKYRSRRVYFDGETTSHLMMQEIFACYSSHTLSDATSDRPSLNLSKAGALMWLAKKHAWHLGMKLVIALFAVYWGLNLIMQLPSILSNALMASFLPTDAAVTSPAPDRPENVTIPEHLQPPPMPYIPTSSPPYSRQFPGGSPPLPPSSGGCADPGCSHDHAAPAPPKPKGNEKITAVFAQGVITDQGRRRIGQTITIDGVEEILKATNVRNGVVVFDSGKVVTVPQ